MERKKERKKVKSLSRVQLSMTPWTVAYKASPSVGFFQARIPKWAAFPSLGDLPNPGIGPGSPALQADALPSEPPGKSGKRKLEAKILSTNFWTNPFQEVSS